MPIDPRSANHHEEAVREWFERRGRRYLRVDWSEAGRVERDPRYEEVPAWQVLDAAEVRAGVRVFCERHDVKTIIGPEHAAPETTSGGGDEPAPAEEEPKAWIEIELQDADGKPVEGETCKVTITNGKVIERATDKYGVVRIDNIDPGKCEVTFPKLADGIWFPV